MRAVRHWAPAYVCARIGELIYQQRFPDEPWLTKTANSFLESYLKDSDIGLEWGSGRSTIWLGRRVAKLTSVEHDCDWHLRVREWITQRELSNIQSFLFETENVSQSNPGWGTDYVEMERKLPKSSLDFAVVDGIFRGACSVISLGLVKPGGIVIVDNANWFLPSKSKSPNSVAFDRSPLTDEWVQFWKAVKDWRMIWTSSGVTDTGIWFKPCR